MDDETVDAAAQDDGLDEDLDEYVRAAEARIAAEDAAAGAGDDITGDSETPAESVQWVMPDVSAMTADEFADFMQSEDRFGPDEEEDEPAPLPAFMALSDKAFDLAVARVAWGHDDPFSAIKEVE